MTDQNSSQIAGLLAEPKVFAPSIDFHGKFRLQRFDFTQSGAGVAADRAVIADLPKGRIRLLGFHSLVAFSAGGASLTMDIGWEAYEQTDTLGTNPVVADQDGLAAAIDVSSAGVLNGQSWNGAGLTADKTAEFRSRDGVTITAQLNGAAIPDAFTLNGYLVYVCE